MQFEKQLSTVSLMTFLVILVAGCGGDDPTFVPDQDLVEDPITGDLTFTWTANVLRGS